jgi:hypothetical protein
MSLSENSTRSLVRLLRCQEIAIEECLADAKRYRAKALAILNELADRAGAKPLKENQVTAQAPADWRRTLDECKGIARLMREEGATWRTIADTLNRGGLRTRTNRRWTGHSARIAIRSVL